LFGLGPSNAVAITNSVLLFASMGKCYIGTFFLFALEAGATKMAEQSFISPVAVLFKAGTILTHQSRLKETFGKQVENQTH